MIELRSDNVSTPTEAMLDAMQSATWDLHFVTHRHVGDAEVDQAVSAFADVWKST